MTRTLSPLFVPLAVFGLACGPTNLGGGQNEGGSGKSDDGDDWGQRDAWSAKYDAGDSDSSNSCATQSCPHTVVDNCGTAEICGNGLDDDCNGQVDEGCPCVPGQVQPCFPGPPGRRNVGMCQDGTQTCQGSSEFGAWGPCTGGIGPTAEVCDTQDNDCNGCVDDNPDCCNAAIQCPNQMPEGAPYTNYVINGTDYFGGSALAWSWTVVGGPCDQLLWSTSSATSYTLNGGHTQTVKGVTASTLTFYPTLSGDYTVTLTVGTANGPLSCTFLVHIKGPGFRTELCWDKTGLPGADLDLHVHRPGTTTPWFTTDGIKSPHVNNDDCYFMNCLAGNLIAGTGPNWGYAHTSVDNCKGAPDDGSQWTSAGYCASPRLDVDNVATAGKPENTNVDNPNHGDRFRVMVHYFGAFATTTVHPMVNIYCGGKNLATYGAAPDLVPSFNKAGDFANAGGGSMWRVVDVTTRVSGGVTTGCDLAPLHPPGSTTGYWVQNNTDLSY